MNFFTFSLYLACYCGLESFMATEEQVHAILGETAVPEVFGDPDSEGEEVIMAVPDKQVNVVDELMMMI